MSSRSSDVVFLNSTVSVALVGALATNAGLGCCDGRVSPVGLARGQVWGVGLGRLDAKEVGRDLLVDVVGHGERVPVLAEHGDQGLAGGCARAGRRT